MVISAWQLGTILWNRYMDQMANEEIAEIAYYPSEDIPELEPWQTRRINFTALQERNPEIIGWIHIPGTEIDYAITQGSNNEFYLRHDAFARPSIAGAIFLDYSATDDFSDEDTFVFGHHQLDGTMFGTLHDFFLEDDEPEGGYPPIIIYTPRDTRMYEFVESFMTQSNLEHQIDRDPHIITLATCNYTDGYSHFAVRAELALVRPPGGR